MKKRKWLAVLLIIILTFTMVGCGKKGKADEEPVTADTETVQEADEEDEEEISEQVTTQDPEVPNTDEEPETQENSEPEEEESSESESTEQETGSAQSGSTQSQAAPAGTAYQKHGKLSLTGTVITDQNGAIYQLHGVSTHGIAWFPQYVTKDTFRTLRDEWGVDCIRLAMYSGENAGYCVGDDAHREELKQLIIKGVDAATDLGMYVIIDWHVLGDCDPNKYADQAMLFFDEMTDRYANYGNVLYEICNEPNGGVTWSQVRSYAERVLPVIRANSPDSIVIVGTPTWSQDVDQAAANPLTGYGNVMYALHFYADTHRDSLRQKMTSALQSGLPIFVSEFGITDASGNGAVNTAEADKWMSLLNDYGVSFCIWSLCNKNESSALIKSSCNKVSGFTYEELSDEGKWFVNMLGRAGEVGNSAVTENNTTSEESRQGTGAGQSQGGNSQSTQGQSVVSQGEVTAELVLSNSWETDGKYYYQYSVQIKNQSGKKITNWQISAQFATNVSVSQSWCGSFGTNAGTLTISPESYNKEIETGGTQADIGFILEASGQTNAQSVAISYN